MSTNPPIKAWSFSLLKDYETCPYRVYLARVERCPQPEIGDDPNHPLTRGDRLHKECEALIRGDGLLTAGIRRFKTRLNDLAAKYPLGTVEVEQRWGFDHNWSSVPWDDPACWLRVICDVVEHVDNHTLIIDDWKSGKSFGNELKHTQQKNLYGTAAMMRYPGRSIVQPAMNYLDEGKTTPSRYTRAVLPRFIDTWTKRAEKLTNAVTFPPKPNRGNCRFCPFARTNGTGACAYAAEN